MYRFKTVTGEVRFDHRRCDDCEAKPCVESCIPKILRLQDGRPVLSIEEKEAAEGGCIECLACELACEFHGKRGLHISLPLPDVKDK